MKVNNSSNDKKGDKNRGKSVENNRRVLSKVLVLASLFVIFNTPKFYLMVF